MSMVSKKKKILLTLGATAVIAGGVSTVLALTLNKKKPIGEDVKILGDTNLSVNTSWSMLSASQNIATYTISGISGGHWFLYSTTPPAYMNSQPPFGNVDGFTIDDQGNLKTIDGVEIEVGTYTVYVSYWKSGHYTTTLQVTITVNPATGPVISGQDTINLPYNQTAKTGVATYTTTSGENGEWQLDGAPAGVTIQGSSSGVASITLNVAGGMTFDTYVFNVKYQLNSNYAWSTKQVTLILTPTYDVSDTWTGPANTTFNSNATTGQVTVGTYQFAGGRYSSGTYSLSGTGSNNFAIDSSTGVLTFTGEVAASSYYLSVNFTNSPYPVNSYNIVVTITNTADTQVVIDGATTVSAIYNPSAPTNVSNNFTASGSAAGYAWTISSENGISLSTNAGSTVQLVVPAGLAVGSYTVQLTATDTSDSGNNATLSVTVNVTSASLGAIVALPNDSTNFEIPYNTSSQTVASFSTTSGVAGGSWALSGDTNFTVSGSGVLTTINGNSLSAGTYNLTVEYSKANYTTVTKAITVVVTSADYTTNVEFSASSFTYSDSNQAVATLSATFNGSSLSGTWTVATNASQYYSVSGNTLYLLGGTAPGTIPSITNGLIFTPTQTQNFGAGRYVTINSLLVTQGNLTITNGTSLSVEYNENGGQIVGTPFSASASGVQWSVLEESSPGNWTASTNFTINASGQISVISGANVLPVYSGEDNVGYSIKVQATKTYYATATTGVLTIIVVPGEGGEISGNDTPSI